MQLTGPQRYIIGLPVVCRDLLGKLLVLAHRPVIVCRNLYAAAAGCILHDSEATDQSSTHMQQ